MAKVVRVNRLGGPECLTVEEHAVREPGPGEVRLKVEAVGLNRSEAMYRAGRYPIAPQLPSLIGYEGVGTIEMLGDDVTGLSVGDRVCVLPMISQGEYGIWAEQAVVPARILLPAPAALSAAEAASIWMQYLTAFALIEVAKIGVGDGVIIRAASSSVGLAAIQLANWAGNRMRAGTYANNGRFKIEGIDAQLDWGVDVGPGTLTVNVVGNYLLDFKVAELPTDPLVEYVGTQGTAVNGLNTNSSYEYRVLTSVGYGIGGARLGLQWQLYSPVENSGEVLDAIPGPLGSDTITGIDTYSLFNLNASYQLTDDIGLRFGVDNLLNEAPPFASVNLANTNPLNTGNLPGGSIQGGVYDTIGRRFYLGANVRF